jgi:hypothetical protein
MRLPAEKPQLLGAGTRRAWICDILVAEESDGDGDGDGDE